MTDPPRRPYPAAAAAWLVGEQRTRVLDLGSGRGRFAAMLQDAGHQVFGLDRDVDRVAALAQRMGTRLHVAGQVESLPFLSCHFDVVTASQTLHRFAPGLALTEIARVLEPGGHLAGSTSQLEAFHSDSRFNYTPFGLAEVMREAGLEVVEMRPGIDGFTLLMRRAMGTPRWFARAWATESPVNRVIGWAGRATRSDHVSVNTAKLVFCGQFSFLARRPVSA